MALRSDSTVHRSIRRLGIAAALVLVAALTFQVSGAPAKKKGKGKNEKPDLEIAYGSVDGKEFALIDKRFNLSLGYETENTGKGRAGPTLTKVFLQHERQRYEIDGRAVPKLRKGAIDKVKNERVVKTNQLPAGKYEVVVCADVKDQEKESNEENNCRVVREEFRTFYSAYQRYAGKVSGTGPGHPVDGNVTERWNSTNVRFAHAEYDDGLFFYEPTSGSVNYTLGGTTATNCNHSGSGTLQLAASPLGYLFVNWRREDYLGVGYPSGHYTVINDCDPSHPIQAPITGFVFQTPGLLVGSRARVQHGAKALKGSYADPFGFGPTNYVWDLSGE